MAEGGAALLQELGRRSGIAAAILAGGDFKTGPSAFEPIGLIRPIAVRGLELALEMGKEIGDHLLGLSLAEDALLDQTLGVDLPRRRVSGDRAVHDRLGKRRLVGLVVAVPAIAEHVDDNILLEAIAELGSDARDMHDSLGIITVHMEDRRLDDLCDIRGIGPRTGVGRSRGKADLIVDDDWNRAALAEALELRQLERFGDEALSDERRIAMHQHADDLVAVGVAALPLLRTDLAEHDRVDRLEMRRIRLQ